MSKPTGIYVNLAPFNFPNFLRIEEWQSESFPVAHLSQKQAAEYWDQLKPLWLEHVKKKAKQSKTGVVTHADREA
jgi:quinol monooxygenase YgiN